MYCVQYKCWMYLLESDRFVNVNERIIQIELNACVARVRRCCSICLHSNLFYQVTPGCSILSNVIVFKLGHWFNLLRWQSNCFPVYSTRSNTCTNFLQYSMNKFVKQILFIDCRGFICQFRDKRFCTRL